LVGCTVCSLIGLVICLWLLIHFLFVLYVHRSLQNKMALVYLLACSLYIYHKIHLFDDNNKSGFLFLFKDKNGLNSGSMFSRDIRYSYLISTEPIIFNFIRQIQGSLNLHIDHLFTQSFHLHVTLLLRHQVSLLLFIFNYLYLIIYI